MGQSRAPESVEGIIENHALKSDGGLVSTLMIKMRWWEGLKPSQVAIRFFGHASPPSVIRVCRTIRRDYEEIFGEIRKLL